MRWSILWRTIILSALDKTLYPYCRHLRELDLQDLGGLLDRLDETKFKKVSQQFFAGDLARFHHVMRTTRKSGASRLDLKAILTDVGDLLTQKAPMLEAISEPASSDVLSTALPGWAARLSHLQELSLWNGITLKDEALQNLLRVYCPKLQVLSIFIATGSSATDSEPDRYLGQFIDGMPNDMLTSFENINTSGIGAQTCLALNSHGRSLTTLKLYLDEEGLLALGSLKGCVC